MRYLLTVYKLSQPPPATPTPTTPEVSAFTSIICIMYKIHFFLCHRLYMSACLSDSLSPYLSLSIFLSFLIFSPFLFHFIYLSVSPSLHYLPLSLVRSLCPLLSLSLSLFLSLCLSLSLSLSLCLSLSLFLSLCPTHSLFPYLSDIILSLSLSLSLSLFLSLSLPL